MHKFKYLVVVFVVLLMNACTSIQKKSFISSFDTYKTLMDVDYVKYQTYLTDAENSHINSLIGKYQALKLKSSFLGIKNQLQNVIQQGTTIIDEIVSDTTLLK